MGDYMSLKLECSCWEEIVAARNDIVEVLPTDIKYRFSEAFSDFLHTYGLEGTYEKLNNRTLSEIFEEHAAMEKKRPIVEGELGGVRYKLSEAPKPEQSNKQYLSND